MKVPSLVEKSPDCLTELAEGFRADRLSVRDYLRKLEGLFAEREPWVNAFVEEVPDRFERLRAELTLLENRFPEPSLRPALYGIPLGVKDIFHVRGFATRAGSRLPPDVLRGGEAWAVTTLRSAGALILGKTVSTEFAYFAPGPTHNPYNPDHTPGGSSSGSAAAVAAGLSPLTLGTQTGGSVLRPASFCGVVGFKPTYDRISREGVVPLSPSQDHVGFFTADVKGAMLAASVLCKGWGRVLNLPPLALGVPEGPYLEKADEEGLNHFRRTCNRLANSGFIIRPIEMLRDIEKVLGNHNAVMTAEAAITHKEWFFRFSDLYHEKTAQLIRKGQGISTRALSECRAGQETFRKEIVTIMKSHDVPVLIAPAAVGPAPRTLESTGDPVMNSPWSYAGLPTVSIPSGLSKDGLPMGLQIIGSWMSDEILLEVAQKVATSLDTCNL